MFILTMQISARTKRGVMAMPLKNAAASDAARDACWNVGRRARRIFEKTTETWEHPVKFDVQITGRKGKDVVGFAVSTEDKIWHWVDEGTDIRYAISAPNTEGGYIPKTTPGVFGSQPSTSFMIPYSYPQPGIEPRNWTTDQRMLWLMRQLLRDELKQKLKGIMNV